MVEVLPDRRILKPELGPGHTYTLNGRQLVPVSSALGMIRQPGLEEWFKAEGRDADSKRDAAAAYGSAVHAGLQAHLTGRKLLPVEMPEDYQRILAAGIAWIDANVEEVLAVEQPICHPVYGYAGTPDLYARLVRQALPCFVDWKTGQVYKTHGYQLAAYREAGRECYPDRPANRKVVQLHREQPGKVQVHTFKQHDRDFRAFGYALGLYQIDRGIG